MCRFLKGLFNFVLSCALCVLIGVGSGILVVKLFPDQVSSFNHFISNLGTLSDSFKDFRAHEVVSFTVKGQRPFITQEVNLRRCNHIDFDFPRDSSQ